MRQNPADVQSEGQFSQRTRGRTEAGTGSQACRDARAECPGLYHGLGSHGLHAADSQGPPGAWHVVVSALAVRNPGLPHGQETVVPTEAAGAQQAGARCGQALKNQREAGIFVVAQVGDGPNL